jgi:hypothetical protein
MGAAAPVGAAMSWTWWRRALAAAIVCLALPAAAAAAEERHAIVIFGAPGGDSYQQTYEKWQKALVDALESRLGFEPSHVHVLSGWGDDPARQSTRENVGRTFEAVRTAAGPDDVVLVVLIGHGSADGPRAKFNLVGPDLEAQDWGALARRLPGRLVFIDSTGASFPFLQQISDRNRIVVTATDSTAQRFDTAFPELLIQALNDPSTDLDRNGRVSLWEVFSQTSDGVRRYYEQRGQLSTERPLLDDNGDRIGQEAGAPGQDGALARTTYLDKDPIAALNDPALTALAARQRALEAQAEQLKLRKSSTPPAVWEAEFEKLMIELARVSRAIRQRS